MTTNIQNRSGATNGNDRRGVTRGVIIGIIITLVIVGVALRGVIFKGGSAAPGAAAAAQGGGPSQMPPMPVDVAPVQVGAIIDEVRSTGRIEAVNLVSLRSDQEGRILELLFTEGQSVQAGAPLIRIDDAMLRAQKERAVSDQSLAQQQLDRVRRLRADNASTPADLERAEATARSAKAAVAIIDLQIERSTVRAPFSGVVGQRFVSAGDYVTSATPLLSMQTTNPQRAVIEVAERYSGSLQRGQTIEFTVAAYPNRTFKAQVEFIDPSVQLDGRAIVVKASAPNPDNALKAGMFIEAKLATATRQNATTVREDAIQPLRTANVVWAVVDGKASRRIVQLGARSRGVVEIISGVSPGEQVVVGGLERMQEGMAVAPRPTGGEGAQPGGGAPPPAGRGRGEEDQKGG